MHNLRTKKMRKLYQTLRVRDPVAPGVNAPFWICFKAHYNNVADIFTDGSVALYIEMNLRDNKLRIIYIYIISLFIAAVFQVSSECLVA